MHVLTKIFIVLVSMLSVLLVPLVVVYTHNENSFKSKYLAEQLQAASAKDTLAVAESNHTVKINELNLTNQDLASINGQLRGDLDTAHGDNRQLESRLASTEGQQADFQSRLAMIASSIEEQQKINAALIDETSELRSQSLQRERQKVELDEALRDVTAQLEVAVAARRKLEEELHRLTNEHGQALEQIAGYVAQFGEIGDSPVLAGGLSPNINLDATVIGVRRFGGKTLIEIDAGSRDGVKKEWVMQIGNGGTFIGNLRITSVDINRSTGEISLEDSRRGLVEVGHHATARKPRN